MTESEDFLIISKENKEFKAKMFSFSNRSPTFTFNKAKKCSKLSPNSKFDKKI